MDKTPWSDAFLQRLASVRFDPPAASAAASAVLVPIVMRPIPTILFTKRSMRLSRHPGQVSFPGGLREAADASLEATALRETLEETGLSADFVTVRGRLRPVETLYGLAISPVVGLVREGFRLAPNDEVAEIFEVPLPFFFDPANRKNAVRMVQGRVWQYYVYCYKIHRIEGATAAITADLVERLCA